MKLHPGDFRLREGDEVDLAKWPTHIEPVCKTRVKYRPKPGAKRRRELLAIRRRLAK